MTRITIAGDRRRRKLITSHWMLGLSIGVIFLIYREMTAILYILATLGVTTLLLIVAFSDLSHADAATGPAVPQDEGGRVTRRSN